MSRVRPDRVKERMDELGLGQSELARQVGIKQPSIFRVLQGETKQPRFLHDIARALGTSTAYLLGETDDPVPPESGSSRAPPSDSPAIDDDTVEIAQIDLRYGLGGAFVDENAIESEPRRFSRQWLRSITSSPPSMLFWTTGRGDSMSTTIADGEVVLGDRSQTDPRDDDLIWACVLGEIGMIKRLRIRSDHIKILSDNPLVPDDTAYPDDDLRIVGRIIAVIHRL